jgi:hypothetical protein
MLARVAVTVAATAATLLSLAGSPRPARADTNDLDLGKLCDSRAASIGAGGGSVLECGWVRRRADGTIGAVVIPGEAEARFRSLMSELGAVMAPRLLVPAQTLGYSGFQLSAELGLLRINRSEAYWNGVEGVSATNPLAGRPAEWLTTAGAFVRKGVWLGLPAVELGAGVVSLLESNLLSWQGYAKLALHEGFPRKPFPSLAVRGSAATLTGTEQARLTTLGLDVIVSKGFGVGGTFRLEPYAAWSHLWMHAGSGLMDVTPSCDAFRVRTSGPGEPLGEYCAAAQRGSDNDRLADVAFPEQTPIRRQRVSAGAKVTFATVFLTGQYEVFPAGRSRDGSKPSGARDDSGRQQGFALSAGFNFQ